MRPSVVRLNRRAIYVVGGVVIVAFVTGLIAVRAQGRRLTEASGEQRIALRPRSQPWFDRVPDQEPVPHPATTDPLPPAPTATSPKAPTDEQESQRRQRVLRAAMSAPIGVSAFEKGNADHASRYRVDSDAGARNPAGVVTAEHRTQEASAPGARLIAGPSDAVRKDTTLSGLSPEYLRATVRKPVSAYEVKAGTIIPAVMLTAINSDLPGQILGQVRENVYDTDTGEHLLIPQGTRLIGLYDHHVVYGQQRVLITWKRLVFPDGSSLTLNNGMPGTDSVGAAGAHDEVNNHYLRTFGNALLLSVISAGVQLSQVPDFGRGFAGPSAGNILGAAVGQQLGSVSAEFLRRGMSVAPTLEIRPGYAFNVMVTHDVIFPGAYEEVSQQ